MSDDFRLEEFKWVTSRIITHESRYYQMLLFYVTGFAAVLGFSDTFPHELIPYIISPLLLVTSTIAFSSRRNQFFSSGYLLVNFYYQIPSISYEEGFTATWQSKKHRNKFWHLIRKTVSFLVDPFMILTLISLFTSEYFGIDFVYTLIANNAMLTIGIYVGGLFVIYALTIRNMLLRRKFDEEYYRDYWRNFVRKRNDQS